MVGKLWRGSCSTYISAVFVVDVLRNVRGQPQLTGLFYEVVVGFAEV